MAEDLDLRLLRHFVAVAEELHFSRAAERLFVAQQAVSRDVRKLEDRAGTTLFDRTSRRVALTPAGRRLLGRARQILSLHDETLRELRGEGRSLLVDVVGQRLTPALVLAAARARADGHEFFARFHGGLDASLPLLAGHRLDVTFGRWHGITGEPPHGLEHHLIRYERISVLVPERHPLAEETEVPLAALRETDACWHCGDHVSAQWEQVMEQLFTDTGMPPAPPRPNVRGVDELAYHIQQWDLPILTISSQPDVPGAVVRPLVQPVAMYPWSMIWRKDLRHPGLAALREAADDLGTAGNWRDLPDGAWLPSPEAGLPRARSRR
ncbi:LysR family transcriptional regulator [Micromonospora costi]|uniref:LysR family transcriptional regulator n=1 Tax=Micromonospora costi TaxID=1530042 RepID=A0A3A9ZUX1_9ACTN|nr:LysR family transcriptional regulator [Micromonospora costi]RKN52009.1 LysR family transcriptional regulator [Micromonospora costi]